MKMKKLSIFILFMGFNLNAAAAQEGGMLNDFDMPLLEGLSENLEGAMLFDSPDGRIINAEATGDIPGARIFAYYKVVLPSLGWKVTEDQLSGLTCEEGAIFCLNAMREKEVLNLSINEKYESAKISFTLSPL
jgi:hypothetical protein